MHRFAVLLALAGSTLVLSAAVAPSAAEPAKKNSSCFLSTDWRGWKASPDSRAIYIHVGLRDYYRLDLASACPQLQEPDAHLVTHSTDAWVCSAIDLDLRVASPPGFAVPCIVRNITPMSQADVDALPKKLKP